MMSRTGRDPAILPWHAEAEEMWNAGTAPSEIARHFGVSKNVIAGLGSRRWARLREPLIPLREPSTLFTRLAAIHAKFERLLGK